MMEKSILALISHQIEYSISELRGTNGAGLLPARRKFFISNQREYLPSRKFTRGKPGGADVDKSQKYQAATSED